MKCFKQNLYQKLFEIFRNFEVLKKLSNKNAIKVGYVGKFSQISGDFSVILGQNCGDFCDF